MSLSYEEWTNMLNSYKHVHTSFFGGRPYYKKTVVLAKLDAAIKAHTVETIRFECNVFFMKNQPGSTDYRKYSTLVKDVQDRFSFSNSAAENPRSSSFNTSFIKMENVFNSSFDDKKEIRPFAGKGYKDEELRTLVSALEQKDPELVKRFKDAFKNYTFCYGTSGKGGGVAKVANIMARSIAQGVTLKTRNPLKREFTEEGELINTGDTRGEITGESQAFSSRETDEEGNHKPVAAIFQAGTRQHVQRSNNFQMMDMYYGDAGNEIKEDGKWVAWAGNLGEKADPDILEFVMYAIKLKFLPEWEIYNTWEKKPGPGKNPYEVFRSMLKGPAYYTDPITDKMYGDDDWYHLKMSATKEISRIIRWGIGEYGGNLIFDGADVYYDQVFNKKDRLADTDLEARVLFQYFNLKVSPENTTPHGESKANWGRGNGTVTFHWHGKETTPSKLLFLTSWQFSIFAGEQFYKLIHPENFAPPLEKFKDTNYSISTDQAADNKFKNFGSKSFQPANSHTKPYTFSSDSDSDSIVDIINSFKVEYMDLWDSFQVLPKGVTPEGVANWLNNMAIPENEPENEH